MLTKLHKSYFDTNEGLIWILVPLSFQGNIQNCLNYKAFKKIIEKGKEMKNIVHLLETKGALNFSFIVIAF